MQSPVERPLRQDVVRNRAAILVAARRCFEEDGIDVPLQRVADAAGLSRASLARHFSSREALIAALWEADIAEIEATASAVSDEPDGFVRLFDFVVGMQVDRRSIRPSPAQIEGGELNDLAARLAAGIGRSLLSSQRSGCVRPEVTVQSALLAIDMCATAITAGADRATRVATWRDARRLTLPGLVTPEWTSAASIQL